MICASPKDGGVTYTFADGALGADWGTEQPIAKLGADPKITFVEWTPATGKEPRLSARPTTIAKDEGDDELEGRDFSADQIDRCARLYVITTKCGVIEDMSYGWTVSGVKAVGAAAAKKACERQETLPVTLIEPAQLANVEAAAKKGCKALFTELQIVDER